MLNPLRDGRVYSELTTRQARTKCIGGLFVRGCGVDVMWVMWVMLEEGRRVWPWREMELGEFGGNGSLAVLMSSEGLCRDVGWWCHVLGCLENPGRGKVGM
ncbi:hypothetical protein Hypma_010522 [Hypsizygus marmoreus]|uniref:Uncharacterized protein n=1 Tax=Hypsizygus marmoreus TaxID=39966 RepID=A0A369JRI9_HYPMA|nr:hypothetical protein Hypma_010522 [Hypsizygus marmoreus]